MNLYEIIDQVAALLQKHGRLSYRAVQYQFRLDEEGLAALKGELIAVRELAVDKDGVMLVWAGEGTNRETGDQGIRGSEQKDPTSSDTRLRTPDARPISYTPPHLAERIRAEQEAMATRGATDGERKTITAL